MRNHFSFHNQHEIIITRGDCDFNYLCLRWVFQKEYLIRLIGKINWLTKLIIVMNFSEQLHIN